MCPLLVTHILSLDMEATPDVADFLKESSDALYRHAPSRMNKQSKSKHAFEFCQFLKMTA